MMLHLIDKVFIEMMNLLTNTWVIGIGTAVIAGLVLAFLLKNKQSASPAAKVSNSSAVSQTVIVNSAHDKEVLTPRRKTSASKDDIKILFVDDDTTFKIIEIIKAAGWKNTSIIDDIKDTDSLEIRSTDIFFIDIKGVAKSLSEKRQGLALAEVIKEKYPKKIVVIYSSDIKGDRSDPALQKVDWFLPKHAEPVAFFNLIEKFSS